jgi:hypothetical protein
MDPPIVRPSLQLRWRPNGAASIVLDGSGQSREDFAGSGLARVVALEPVRVMLQALAA